MSEHDPRAVEALAVVVHDEVDGINYICHWHEAPEQRKDECRKVARMILTREAALKADAEWLVAALEDAECELSSIARIHRARLEQVALAKIRDALRAHRASRQPSEPTLAEAVEVYIDRSTDDAAFQAMRAALAREKARA